MKYTGTKRVVFGTTPPSLFARTERIKTEIHSLWDSLHTFRDQNDIYNPQYAAEYLVLSATVFAGMRDLQHAEAYVTSSFHFNVGVRRAWWRMYQLVHRGRASVVAKNSTIALLFGVLPEELVQHVLLFLPLLPSRAEEKSVRTAVDPRGGLVTQNIEEHLQMSCGGSNRPPTYNDA